MSKVGSIIASIYLKQRKLFTSVKYLLGELAVEAVPVDAGHPRHLQLQLVLSQESVEVGDAVTPSHL